MERTYPKLSRHTNPYSRPKLRKICPGRKNEPSEDAAEPEQAAIDEDGEYASKEDVALYIHTYGKLPKNFIKKSEAKKLGWEGGSLEPYAPGRSIGGDRFGNYEGLLPEAEGRRYTECDIDTMGRSSRGQSA